MLGETRDQAKNWPVRFPAPWELQTCFNQLHRSGLRFAKPRQPTPVAGMCTSTGMLYTGLDYTWIVGGTCRKVAEPVGTATYMVGDNLKYALVIDPDVLKPNA